MQELNGRVAVITGAGGGIGEGLAREAQAAGMRVVVSDIAEAEAERVAAALREAGGESIAVRTDVIDRASVEALADAAYGAFGAVHLLCNNAGVMKVAQLEETGDADWQWTLSVNVIGPAHGIEVFVPRMRAQIAASGGEAYIVNTASIAGMTPIAGIGAYTASKFAVVGMSEALREELADAGIGVSVVCPGSVATGIFEAERNRQQEFGGAAPSEVRTLREDESSGDGADGDRMDPREAARRILAGVRADRMFIFTHPHLKERTQERFGRILADFDAAVG